MPGLIRGMARTAVVAGTASAVSGRVQRRQAERFAARDQQIAANRAAGWYGGAAQQGYGTQQGAGYQQAPGYEQQYQQAPGYEQAAGSPAPAAGSGEPTPATPASGGTDALIAQLRQLGDLRDQGILTEEEFAAQKAKLLGN